MTKTEDLVTRLKVGWCPAIELEDLLGWKSHSLRAAISGIGKSHKIERQRINGVTSYRIAPQEQSK